MTISEQVVKAMPDRIYAVKRTEGSNCVVSFDTPSLDYNVEYVRADLVLFHTVQGASAARELALEEAARAAENAMLEYNLSECAGLADWAAFEAGQESGLKHAAAAIRALSSPDHPDSSKSTSDQKVCQTCNDRGIIGGMHRVGDGDVDAWEETCPDCQKVKAHHSDADTGADDLVQIALHLNCEPDADSILHVIREIQADIDIAKHADAGKVEGDDGRPCSMDEFMAALFNEKVDEFDVSEAAASWLHGDWKDALSYLTDVPTHWRPLPSAPSGGDRHGE